LKEKDLNSSEGFYGPLGDEVLRGGVWPHLDQHILVGTLKKVEGGSWKERQGHTNGGLERPGLGAGNRAIGGGGWELGYKFAIEK
jgi:hypothetical protein